MTDKTVVVPNISCNHCVMTIKRELSELTGVSRVEGDAPSKQITVEWDESSTDWDKIQALLVEINYPPAE